jgi:hypothetical protein
MRRIATRRDRKADNYLAFLQLGMIVVLTRSFWDKLLRRSKSQVNALGRLRHHHCVGDSVRGRGRHREPLAEGLRKTKRLDDFIEHLMIHTLRDFRHSAPGAASLGAAR